MYLDSDEPEQYLISSILERNSIQLMVVDRERPKYIM